MRTITSSCEAAECIVCDFGCFKYWLFDANEHVSLWKLWNFAFVKGFLAFVRCFAMAIDMFRLVVCWNHVDGVALWW